MLRGMYSSLRSVGRNPTPAQALRSVRFAANDFWPSWHVARRSLFFEARPASFATTKGELSRCGRDESMRRLEAVLLLAREPLSSRKIAQLAQLEDGTQARTLIRRLNGLLDDAGRAFRVEEVAGGYQLLTRQKFASWLRRLSYVPGDARLSTVALETLSVVAYRQPVLKADIEAIRGVNCGEILRQLMERDLVRIGGRSEELGRPYLYTTTKRFLQQFGLRSLDDLPRAEILRAAALPPVVKGAASGHHTSTPIVEANQTVDKESDVSVTLFPAVEDEQELARRYGASAVPGVRLDDDDDDFDDEEVDEDEDDFDDDEDEELDDEEEDDDLEEDEWEEVEDDESELDEEDEDWDDEEDEEWDDEEEDEADDEDEDDEDWDEDEEEADEDEEE
jgi:segregation and condensation protein B